MPKKPNFTPLAPLPETPYRAKNGALQLKGLFFETSRDPSAVLYTLKDHDHGPYRSLKRLYLETDDPTEYRFYTAYLEGLKHWEALCGCNWFKPYVAQWRKELFIKLQSKALQAIRAEAESEGKNAFSANKYLLEHGWDSEPSKRGRPSKREVQEAASQQAQDEKRISEDYERLQDLQVPSSPGSVN